MFRKGLSFLIALLLIVSVFSVWPVTASAAEESEEISADVLSDEEELISSGAEDELAPSGVSIPSEADFVKILNELRKKYPPGGRFSGVYYENGIAKAWTCHGYACQMLYEIFGIQYYNGGYFQNLDYSFGTIYAGDLVRIDGNSHSVIITKVEDGYVWYTDANIDNNNTIAWDTKISLSELRSRFTYKMHISGNTLTGTGKTLPFEPADVGTNFYANIRNLACGKSLTVVGTNVEITGSNGSTGQKWYFERQSDDSYKITHAATGLCLDDAGASSADKTNIIVYTSNGSDAQRWYFKPVGGGYSLVPKCAVESCLDLPGGVTDDGTNVQLYRQNSSAAQIYVPNIQPSFEAQNLGDEFIASVIHDASSTAMTYDASNNVAVRPFEESEEAQMWVFTRMDDRSYKIMNLKAGLCLDDVNYGAERNSNIHLWTSNDSTAQRWFIRKNGTGYTLVPKCAVGLAMDLYGGDSSESSNLALWPFVSGNTNMVFSLRYELSSDADTTYENNRYELYNVSLPWEEAYQFCELKGGHLLQIESEQEQRFAENFLSSDTDKSMCWLGATDDHTEGSWKWINAKALTYENWFPGEPNGGEDEDRLSMNVSSGLWSDAEDLYTVNDSGYAFVCEYEHDIDPSDYQYDKFFVYDGRRYEVYPQNVDWQTAKTVCELKGGHLLTISSMVENNAVRKSLSGASKERYWMGLTDIGLEGSWHWVTGEQSTCSSWVDGQPDNASGCEHYAEYIAADGLWDDVVGYAGNFLDIGFICEYGDGVPLPAEFILGDADIDGAVTVMDATHIQRFLASFALNSFDSAAADVDTDASVTVIDAIAIQKYLVRLSRPGGIGEVHKR